MVRRLLGDFRWSILPVPGRVLAVIFFVLLFILPLITHALIADDDGILLTFTITCIYAIFAVSWDLLSGYSGQISFGHALCFGCGAYISAILYLRFHLPPTATIPIATVGATLIGVVTCLPALRLRAPYISLLTMALPVILASIIKELPREWLGGKYGLPHIPPLAHTATGTYYICLIVMAVSVLIMWKLTDAGSRYIRTGLIFHAIREDEIAARATGINTIRYKILAFAFSGFFAGIAGALIAHVTNGASPDHFSLLISFNAIIWVVFGGIVSIYGGVVGVFALYPILDLLSQYQAISPYRTLIVTVIIIVILLFMPEGVAVWIRDKIERECPRCKLGNVAWRKECRACGAPLH